MTILTPDSHEIKMLNQKVSGPMFIRIGDKGHRPHNIYFSHSAVKQFGLKKYERIVFVIQDDEVWITRRQDGFIVRHSSKVFKLCCTSLVKILEEKYKKKSPFKLPVVLANGSLYIKRK